MKCEKCGFENTDTAKFCIKCGTALLQGETTTKSPKNKKTLFIIGGILAAVALVWAGIMLFGTKNIKGSEMVYVKGGTFQMGSESNEASSVEKPIHSVMLDDFYISKYEITNAQFCKFLNEKGNQKEDGVTWLEIESEDCLIEKSGGIFKPKDTYEINPVIEVSWHGAKAYCEWAGGSLPTEAEWEYAARGGVETHGRASHKYAGSNNIDEVAWYDVNSYDKGKDHADFGTHYVGSKKPNELGIFDMTGNVWEWCSDWYLSDYYSSSPTANPKGASDGSSRVYRGGSWFNGAKRCRVAYRDYGSPTYRIYYLGFRLVFVP